jgi:hypothetical protein
MQKAASQAELWFIGAYPAPDKVQFLAKDKKIVSLYGSTFVPPFVSEKISLCEKKKKGEDIYPVFFSFEEYRQALGEDPIKAVDACIDEYHFRLSTICNREKMKICIFGDFYLMARLNELYSAEGINTYLHEQSPNDQEFAIILLPDHANPEGISPRMELWDEIKTYYLS